MKRLAFAALLLPFAAFAQGPLAPPPGPPVPSMRTLDQIEARIPLTAATAPGTAGAVHVISTPGSYYLTGNVQGVSGKDGILIEASNVTLDLNGFTLTGAAGSLHGIALSRSNTDRSNLTIRNGTINGFGERGISNPGTAVINGFLAEDLTVSCSGAGIRVTNGSSVIRRVFVRSGAGGILCVNSTSLDHVSDSVVTGINGEGIFADVVENCQLSHFTLGGFFAVNARKVSNTRVAQVTGTLMVGISADEVTSSVVTDFTASEATPVLAIQADHVADCQVANMTSGGGDVTGIDRKTANLGLVRGCSVSGLKTTGSGTATGIRSGTVEGCQLTKIGFESATGTVLGIGATSMAVDCGLLEIGHAGVTSTVTGIATGSNFTILDSGSIEGVDLRMIRGSGTVIGFLAATIRHSTVKGLAQSTSTGAAYGMTASLIEHCGAEDLSIKTSNGSSCAITAGTVLSSRVGNASNLTAFVGIAGIIATVAETCTVEQVDGTGISTYGKAARVKDCKVSDSGIFAGIRFDAEDGLLEGNTVGTCNSGIITGASAKVLVRGNSVMNCAVKYNLGAATRSGPIVTVAGVIANTSPFANFSD